MASHVAELDDDGWPYPLLRTVSGKQPEATLLDAVAGTADIERCSYHRTRLFEALYYSASTRLARGEVDAAKRYFAAAAQLQPNGDNRELMLLDYRMTRLGIGPRNMLDAPPAGSDTTRSRPPERRPAAPAPRI